MSTMLGRRYLGILKALEAASVRYLVVGGVAVNLHGYTRFTKDLDLLIDLDPANALRAMEALRDCGLQARVPVELADFADASRREEWFTLRNMLVFQMIDPDDPFCSVDVFIRNPIDFDQAWGRALVETMGEARIRVAAIDDLIVMKRLAGRPVDLGDIEALADLIRTQGSAP